MIPEKELGCECCHTEYVVYVYNSSCNLKKAKDYSPYSPHHGRINRMVYINQLMRVI